jgi:hypothetical protein
MAMAARTTAVVSFAICFIFGVGCCWRGAVANGGGSCGGCVDNGSSCGVAFKLSNRLFGALAEARFFFGFRPRLLGIGKQWALPKRFPTRTAAAAAPKGYRRDARHLRDSIEGLAPQMCGRAASPLLGRGAGGRSPGYLISSDDGGTATEAAASGPKRAHSLQNLFDRFGASLPMRMTASWFRSLDLPHTRLWRDSTASGLPSDCHLDCIIVLEAVRMSPGQIEPRTRRWKKCVTLLDSKSPIQAVCGKAPRTVRGREATRVPTAT